MYSFKKIKWKMQKERWKIFKLLFMLYVFCRVRTIFFMSEYFCGIFVCHINMNITYHHPLRFRFSFVAILFFFFSRGHRSWPAPRCTVNSHGNGCHIKPSNNIQIQIEWIIKIDTEREGRLVGFSVKYIYAYACWLYEAKLKTFNLI